MNGRWSREGEIIGSDSAETMAGRASPAVVRARAACISSLRSPAIRMTSDRLSGEGNADGCAAATPDDDVSIARSSTPEGERRFMSITESNDSSRAGFARPVALAPLPPDGCELLVHLCRGGRFLRLVSRQAHEPIAVDGRLRDARAAIGLRHRAVFLDRLAIAFGRRGEVLRERVVVGRGTGAGRERTEFVVSRLGRTLARMESGGPLGHRGRYAGGTFLVIRGQFAYRLCGLFVQGRQPAAV